jgi:hypothetical protein
MNRMLRIGIAAGCLALGGCGAMQTEATSTELTDTTAATAASAASAASAAPKTADGKSAALLSAFFGLDNGLFQVANRICNGAAGQDGMPVIVSA